MALLAVASENTAISAVFVPSTTYYLSLHSATPGQNGASEITGGSYARQVIQFGAASGGSESSTDSQTFTNLPAEASGIPYFGMDGGNGWHLPRRWHDHRLDGLAPFWYLGELRHWCGHALVLVVEATPEFNGVANATYTLPELPKED